MAFSTEVTRLLSKHFKFEHDAPRLTRLWVSHPKRLFVYTQLLPSLRKTTHSRKIFDNQVLLVLVKMALPPGATQLIVVSFIVGPMSMVAVALRLWSRYLQKMRLVNHDYLALTALILARAHVSVFFVG